jgi:ketosteroid isomerase-like protein
MSRSYDCSEVAMTERACVQAFIEHINAHDVGAIGRALAPAHVFIDSLGTRVEGAERVREGWQAYLRAVPDYRLTVEKMFSDAAEVVVLGRAGGTWSPDGTLHERHAWTTPAAFRARVQDGRITLWQVYADNEPIRRCTRQRA